MSLAVAVPLGIGSALVYGTSIVFQHSEAHQHGKTDTQGLLALPRNPRWLLAIGGDFIGFLLQIAASSAGPVVVIQPLVVLMLPVALVVGWLMGGPRPRLGDYLGSARRRSPASASSWPSIGTPGAGHVPRSRYIAMTMLLVLAVGLVAQPGRHRPQRGRARGHVRRWSPACTSARSA